PRIAPRKRRPTLATDGLAFRKYQALCGALHWSERYGHHGWRSGSSAHRLARALARCLPLGRRCIECRPLIWVVRRRTTLRRQARLRPRQHGLALVKRAPAIPHRGRRTVTDRRTTELLDGGVGERNARLGANERGKLALRQQRGVRARLTVRGLLRHTEASRSQPLAAHRSSVSCLWAKTVADICGDLTPKRLNISPLRHQTASEFLLIHSSALHSRRPAASAAAGPPRCNSVRLRGLLLTLAVRGIELLQRVSVFTGPFQESLPSRWIVLAVPELGMEIETDSWVNFGERLAHLG